MYGRWECLGNRAQIHRLDLEVLSVHISYQFRTRNHISRDPLYKYCHVRALRQVPVVYIHELIADSRSDHAVSASTVYLIRSVGTVWGVAITSAIVQTVLKVKLPAALGDIPNKAQVSSPVSSQLYTVPEADRICIDHRPDSTFSDRLEASPIIRAIAGTNGVLRRYSICVRSFDWNRRFGVCRRIICERAWPETNALDIDRQHALKLAELAK